jgi:hypothetical protein
MLGNPQRFLQLDDEALIKAHLQAAERSYDAALASSEAGRAMLAAEAERRAVLAASALELWASGLHDAGRVASDLLRASADDWTPARLLKIVEAAAAIERSHAEFTNYNRFPFKPLINAVEKAAVGGRLPKDLCAALQRWKAAITPRELIAAEERELAAAGRIALADDQESLPWSKVSEAFQTMERLERIRKPLTDERKLLERLTILLSKTDETGSGRNNISVHIDPSDAVGSAIADAHRKGGRASGGAWAALLEHARTLNTAVPSRRWTTEAVRLVAQTKSESFGSCVDDWFNLAGKPSPSGPLRVGEVADATLLNDCSVELLKGLAWAVSAAGRADLTPALGNLAEACYKKIPNKGPRNVKVGNAAVGALAAMAKPEAAAQLTRLQLHVKHRSARAAVEKALKIASQRAGLSREELAEMSLPTFGLKLLKSGEAGVRAVRSEKLGIYTANLCVTGSRTVELTFLAQTTKGAKRCHEKAIPSAARQEHPEALKRLKREAKDASLMLSSQALRLEKLLMSERTWALDVWRERYLNHPLIGGLTRRLIWRFDDRLAVVISDCEFITTEDRKLTPRRDAIVSLWHPIQSQPEEVLAWRQWLERHEVSQPFKQAHREVCVLTDAERRTGDYSNRFAAHILRQHQFAALCQERGWDYSLHGDFDAGSVPTVSLAAHNMKAEFWVEPIPNQLTPRGIFLYVTTDQVRFWRTPAAGAQADEDEAARQGTYEPGRTGITLAEIPAVLFSEVMRDVDLFVGVASVANDPTWNDNAPRFAHAREYWQDWSFGELSESAKTRRAVLEKLLPRLASAGRFSVAGKFLIVRGELRTYKIHLGSGNVLMEPNDQYLCIVRAPVRADSPRVFLPFEGDSTLALILSKAFLFAADDRITDPTITRQIRS